MKIPNPSLSQIKKTLSVIIFVALLAGLGYWYRNQPKQASVTTTSSSVRATINQEIEIPIIIDTQGQVINAGEIFLNFDPKLVKVVAVGKVQSLFTLWIKDQPAFSNETGEVSFAGGLPTPGFSGKGQIGSISLIPLKKQRISLAFNQKTRILLNDGQGTAIPLAMPPIVLNVRE